MLGYQTSTGQIMNADNLYIRQYQPGEEQQLWELFYHTIHLVNIQDYSALQVNAWAPRKLELTDWIIKIHKRSPFVCLLKNKIVGYSDLQENGYIDHFFCHHDYQGKGVGRALMAHINKLANQQKITKLTAEVSLTARAFFEAMGFEVVRKQQVLIRQQLLTNYKMHKILKG